MGDGRRPPRRAEERRATVYYATLVMWIGCHADSQEYARWFGDDIAVRGAAYLVDWSGLPYLRFLLGNVAHGESPLHRARVLATLLRDARGQAGAADQPPEASARIAWLTEAGEQSLTADTVVCAPAGQVGGWTTASADSVPCGPASPRTVVLAPSCNWPRLALNTVTAVVPEVVTGTRVPAEVTTVKPAVPASATVPRAVAMPGTVSCGPAPTMTKSAAIVPWALSPATLTAAPSAMAPRSAPDALSLVAGAVVTVTSWPLAVLMTTSAPLTRSSVPLARCSRAHPLTAVRVVVDDPDPDRWTCTTPDAMPAPTRRTSAAAALPATTMTRRADRDLQHVGDLGKAEPGAENKAQQFPVG